MISLFSLASVNKSISRYSILRNPGVSDAAYSSKKTPSPSSPDYFPPPSPSSAIILRAIATLEKAEAMLLHFVGRSLPLTAEPISARHTHTAPLDPRRQPSSANPVPPSPSQPAPPVLPHANQHPMLLNIRGNIGVAKIALYQDRVRWLATLSIGDRRLLRRRVDAQEKEERERREGREGREGRVEREERGGASDGGSNKESNKGGNKGGNKDRDSGRYRDSGKGSSKDRDTYSGKDKDSERDKDQREERTAAYEREILTMIAQDSGNPPSIPGIEEIAAAASGLRLVGLQPKHPW